VSKLALLKSTFNAKNVIHRLSWFISSDFSAVHSWIVSHPEIAKNSVKPLFWGFKVVQYHRYWYPQKARQQCLLISSKSASICNHSDPRRSNSGKIQGNNFLWGYLFDALVRGESPHPAARNLLTTN